jgi:hypothetical protein
VAQRILNRGKHAYVLGIGDRDPDGRWIRHDAETKIKEYAPGAEIDFMDLALTIDQIEDPANKIEYRETKGTSNAYMGPMGDDPGFGKAGDYTSAEIDALPPNVLRQIVEAEVTRDLEDYIAEVREAEEADLERLREVAVEFDEEDEE